MEHRNLNIDKIRGFAILLVVLGHTITGCIEKYDDLFIYNMIWSLQMPLFFIISGYLIRYSKSTTTFKDMLSLLKKRTCSLLIPYAVWTFFIRGFLLGESSYFNLKYLLFNMDSGYWFLISLWTISTIFIFSIYLSSLFSDKKINSTLYVLLLAIAFTIGLLGVGLVFGISFFNIKLTAYYVIFFTIGYVFGKFQDEILNCSKFVNIIVALSTTIWIYILLNNSIVAFSDSFYHIIIRFFCSLCGCICCFGLILPIFVGKIGLFIGNIGVHTLEIYLIHYIYLCAIPKYLVNNIAESLLLVLLNFILTMGLSFLTIALINQNSIINKCLFWKV